jgi:hypothetical protein
MYVGNTPNPLSDVGCNNPYRNDLCALEDCGEALISSGPLHSQWRELFGDVYVESDAVIATAADCPQGYRDTLGSRAIVGR